MKLTNTKKYYYLISFCFSTIGLEATSINNRSVKIHRADKIYEYNISNNIKTVGCLKNVIRRYHSTQEYDGFNFDEKRQIIINSKTKKILNDEDAIPSEKLELVLIIKFYVFLSTNSQQRFEVLCRKDCTISELKAKISEVTGVITQNKGLGLLNYMEKEDIEMSNNQISGEQYIKRKSFEKLINTTILNKRMNNKKLNNFGLRKVIKENTVIVVDNAKSLELSLSLAYKNNLIIRTIEESKTDVDGKTKIHKDNSANTDCFLNSPIGYVLIGIVVFVIFPGFYYFYFYSNSSTL